MTARVVVRNNHMNLTSQQRESVANSQRITKAIGEKLKENEGESKVDLTRMAQELSERRIKLINS